MKRIIAALALVLTLTAMVSAHHDDDPPIIVEWGKHFAIIPALAPG